MEKEVLMADTSVSFKCPNCSAPLAYAPGADHVTCEYLSLIHIYNSKGFAVVVRETLKVILNECEGSIPVVRKAVRRHQSHRSVSYTHLDVYKRQLLYMEKYKN